MTDSPKYVVEFFLASRYFQTKSTSSSTMLRSTCINCCTCAFGFDIDWATVMHRQSEGFFIICTPEQFTAFLMNRYHADECNNGFKDLKPRYLPADRVGFASEIAAKAGTTRDVVTNIASLLQLDLNKLALRANRPAPGLINTQTCTVDVSQTLYNPIVESRQYLREDLAWTTGRR